MKFNQQRVQILEWKICFGQQMIAYLNIFKKLHCVKLYCFQHYQYLLLQNYDWNTRSHKSMHAIFYFQMKSEWKKNSVQKITCSPFQLITSGSTIISFKQISGVASVRNISSTNKLRISYREHFLQTTSNMQ